MSKWYKHSNNFDVIIVGGGLAGLTAAIHLSKLQYSVLVFEKNSYPHHKVCGEYVSREVIPYLDTLDVSFNQFSLPSINQLKISTVDGKLLQTNLPLGGIGISRYAFDNLFYEKASENNAQFKFDSVKDIIFSNNKFTVHTKDEEFSAEIVIGAYGKRDQLDKQLKRKFIDEKSGWLGVKAHYHLEDFPKNMVELHSFNGGYAGLSKTETGAVNCCYLASYKSFKKERNVEAFTKNTVAKNPCLNDFFNNSHPIFKEPMAIAQVSFSEKKSVHNHILMCGDTAGLIHPLCGNGMAMAIHSAKLAAEEIDSYFKNSAQSRADLEKSYEKRWNRLFKKRLWMGRRLQSILLNDTLSKSVMTLITKSPWLLNKMISATHGKPIV
ncbi:NAD(P)/FAD-dependent oxidoreductase [Galbibacter mesophilus]|uniref:NAD(P)/FAD-dependent oxidoreductase n=1 Tax=Galbibacter mesophilus TaxID=379069 RepID=UPI00191FBB1E|nr:NAD(P)/FAD-dependent oxidoreductase [Galbibacter mesophilus]MCM5663265.1 NAD(P)/FAD-dependent oxidoreductase [Galbibacter mesophilus]